MVEGTGLENRHTGNGIESSNLSLSAVSRTRTLVRITVVVIWQLHRGRVAEWLKAHAWKVCLGQKPNVGSNPTPSVANRRLTALL